MAIKTLKIQPGQIKGLMQGLDENLLKPSYSPDCQNIDVSEGIISTRKGSSKNIADTVNIEDATYGTPQYVCGIMRLNGISNAPKAVYNDEGITIVGAYYDHMVEGQKTYWYAYYKKTSVSSPAWHMVVESDGTTPAMIYIYPKYAQFVEYLISDEHCLVVVGGSTPQKLYLDNDAGTYTIMAEDIADAPLNAAFVTLHKERVWAAGNTAGLGGAYVDGINTVYYANLYDPEDWTTAGETGEIVIETNDGDYIRGMANLLDDVFIFKKNTIWRVDGDEPSKYSISQVYAAQGISHFNAVCSDGNTCFIAGDDGIYQYTGVDFNPVLTKEITDIFPDMSNVKLTILNNKLYVWSRDINTIIYDRKAIEYDIRTKVISLVYAKQVHDAFVLDNKVVFMDSNYIYELDEDSLLDDEADVDAYWFFPESDCKYPNAEKTLTGIYFTGWGTMSAGAAGGQVKITVYYTKANGTQATKEKIVTLQTTRKLHKQRFYARGRIFKFKFENVDGSAINISNPEFVFELAED